MGEHVAMTLKDWARIRFEYECTDRKVYEICEAHGISQGTLRHRIRRWGWPRRQAGRPVPLEGPPPVDVSIIGVQAECQPEHPAEPVDELRESLKRQIEAIMEEERQARPRRYLAAWEEFAAEAANAMPAGTAYVAGDPSPKRERKV